MSCRTTGTDRISTGDDRNKQGIRSPFMTPTDPSNTLSVLEAARRLGKSPDAIRGALRRGTLPGYRGNDGEWRVDAAALPAETPISDDSDALRQDLDRIRDELRQALADGERWRRQAEDGRVAAAELRTRVELLQQTLDRELARGDRLEAELAELRTPWWVRVLAALRR